MNRRNFLAAASWGAASAGIATGAGPARVVDAHVHFYDPARPQGVPWPSRSETVLYKPTYPERYLAAVRPLPLNGAVAVEASPWLEDDLWLLRVADANPVVVAVVGNIRVAHPDFKDSLDRFSRHPLFRGIRINAATVTWLLGQGGVPADLKLLAEKNLSLDVLLDDRPRFSDVARLAALLPDLRIVLGHLPLDRPTDDLHALARCPRVYAKVSGVARRVNGRVPTDAAFYKAALDELWDVFGPDRAIYASNWPVCDLIASYPVVYGIVRDYLAGKEQETAEKYFWKNALAFYQCRERARG